MRKSNGVLTTRKRSGQVKPSNSMPSDRRTSLRAPSAPISQRPRSRLDASVPLDRDLHAGRMLGDALRPRCRIASSKSGLLPQLLVQDAGQLRLLGLHPVGMGGRRRRWRRNRIAPAPRAAWCDTGTAARSVLARSAAARRRAGRACRGSADGRSRRATPRSGRARPRAPSPARRARTRLAAAMRPTGPAPAIRTRSSMVMLVRSPSPYSMIIAWMRAALLDLRDARLGDDVAPLERFRRR